MIILLIKIFYSMKKSILTFCFAFITALNFAQTTDHLTFKNVSIDGQLSIYISKMKLNGFNLIQTKDGTAILNGEFAGYKNCTIKVSTLSQIDLVHKITVDFQDEETWSRLWNNYLELKEMLIEKYGKPSDVFENIEKINLDDIIKMYQVSTDKLKYSSIWQTDKGKIQLSLDHNNYSGCFVKLSYLDKINSEKVKTRAKSDL